ncbi:MAG: DnaD domain protein [Lachnospiraceae bacterium]|nr:DnaD domain protein [Lachnospiraceae bacterium]
MSNLKLSCNAYNMTPVPTEFLDTYMPHANGEFVKVYLRLLRLAASGQTSALSDVADTLSCTEKDVARALRYWEKAGLLKLQSDAGGEITGIAFVPITAETGGTGPADTGKDGYVTSERETNAPTDKTPALRRRVPESTVPKRKQLTAARITQLEDTEDFMYLLFVSGQYLGRNLTRTDIDTLGYFYDELHMGVDLIEYLIEYCVSNNHTSIRYIETVGLAWHSEGITTVEAAKDVSRKYNKDYYAILKALGIYNHSPISAEIQLMDKWMKTYSFTIDVIREACTRTVMQTAKPTLAYADGILTRWYNEHIRTLEDVKNEDELRRQKKSQDQKKPSQGKNRKPSGSFYNFEQRNYDKALEKQLLGISDPGLPDTDSED